MSASDVKSAEIEHLETGNGHVQGTVRLYSGSNELRFIPVPTIDPNDPLRLPRWRKIMILWGMILYGAVGLATVSSVGAIMPIFQMEYMDPHIVLANLGIHPNMTQIQDLSRSAPPGVTLPKGTVLHWIPPPGGYKTQSQLALLANMPSLFLGLSNFFSVPLSCAVGRRPLLLSGMIVTTAALIWVVKSQSFSQHLAARCLIGLGSGNVESLAVLILYDINFVHRRGIAIGAMWACIGLISYSLNIMSTAVSVAVGWRWLYGIFAIISGVSLVFSLFFVPETRYSRPLVNIDGEIIEADAYGYVRSVGVAGNLKDSAQPQNLEATHRRTWFQDLKLFRGPVTWQPCFRCYVDVFKSIVLPNVVWVVVLNSIGVTLSVGGIVTFASPLLTWQNGGRWLSKNVGLATIAMLPAAILSFVVAGWGMDFFSQKMAKSNGGVHEPEHRLVAITIPVLGCFVGCLLFGISAADTERYHWIVFLIGHSLMGFGFLSLNTALSVYAVECYPRLAGPMLIMVSALRNCVSFAINFKIVDFVALFGYDGAFGIYAGLAAGMSLFAIPFYVWGKRIRRWGERLYGYA